MFFVSFIMWMSWFNIIRLSPLPLKPAHARVSKDEEFDLKNRFTAFCHGLSLMLGAIYTYYIVRGFQSAWKLWLAKLARQTKDMIKK